MDTLIIPALAFVAGIYVADTPLGKKVAAVVGIGTAAVAGAAEFAQNIWPF